MKFFLLFPVIAIAVLAAGCQSTTAKGAGAVKMTLVRPVDQSLRPGEINTVSVMILRENFYSDVRISFSGLPEGVKVLEGDRRFKQDDIVVDFTLHAANDAPQARDVPVTVTATGPDGLTASEMFHVTVLAPQAGMR
jgi:hypothetical protein